MTDLIRQRTPHDCAIACMAMLTGRSWEDTSALVGHLVDYEGERRGMRREDEALKLLGFDDRWENGEPVGSVSHLHRGFYISPEYFRSIAWGRRALMAVPSLNIPGGWHMIYWDGTKVFDPSPLKTYTRWCDLKPDDMHLFREVG